MTLYLESKQDNIGKQKYPTYISQDYLLSWTISSKVIWVLATGSDIKKNGNCTGVISRIFELAQMIKVKYFPTSYNYQFEEVYDEFSQVFEHK